HPILKPVYDHHTGSLTRPQYIEPREFVIIEGLLPLHTKLAAACFDVTVYLNPPEDIRREWKIKRDTAKRGYTPDQVVAELERRESESGAWIRPQRDRADMVVRFAPIAQRDEPPGTPLSAELLLRPTIRHPDLSAILAESGESMHLKLSRDENGRPADTLHVHGYAPREASRLVEKALWDDMGEGTALPEVLGDLGDGTRSEPLAITQLLLLFHLIEAAR
ncbi:MAG: phosphoribulokinase, partial [Streptosporangiales bacterium]|nr:phosphoribulokinase [Streptosporangiales bacterium]